ncbi:MAG: tol-pal system-associated acyl-CoA thioesterase [Pseudomonadota bacterium]
MKEFIWPVRVYYEDTDSGGVVYYANYLKFMERARSEWLRSLGFEQDELARSLGVLFVVRAVTMNFCKPGRFNELLNVSVKVAERGKATLSFEQNVMNSMDNAVLCSGRVKLACVDAATWNPRPVPAPILTEISRDH